MNTITNPGFSAKDTGETVILGFDFVNLTSTPSAPVIAVTRHAGAADASPGAIISGSPSISGTKVLQKVVAGVTGTDYLLRCTVSAPDGSVYILAGVLPVRTA